MQSRHAASAHLAKATAAATAIQSRFRARQAKAEADALRRQHAEQQAEHLRRLEQQEAELQRARSEAAAADAAQLNGEVEAERALKWAQVMAEERRIHVSLALGEVERAERQLVALARRHAAQEKTMTDLQRTNDGPRAEFEELRKERDRFRSHSAKLF